MKKSIDGILGLVIGDALGVPNEFCIREKLQENPVTEMVGYGSHNQPKGTWSDDSSMTIATIDSINEVGCINVNNIADKFLDWMNDGKYTNSGRVFDIGRRTLQSLCTYNRLKDDSKITNKKYSATVCGGKAKFDNGNGSLMRILPVSYYAYSKNLNKEELLELVRQVSSITHAHEISIIGCYMYCLMAIKLLEGESLGDSIAIIRREDFSMFSKEDLEPYKRLMTENFKTVAMDEIRGSGYVVDTLESAVWCLENSCDFENALVKAVNIGEDTDTVGAVTGGLAGIYYGVDEIKESWKKDLKKIDYIYELCNKFDKTLESVSGDYNE